jgi:hypothetical protein
VVSRGQYGHLNVLELLFVSFWMDCLHRTWPHRMSIGGLSTVLCSRDTGHANTEWNWYALSSSISTGICFRAAHSCIRSTTYISYHRDVTWEATARLQRCKFNIKGTSGSNLFLRRHDRCKLQQRRQCLGACGERDVERAFIRLTQ